MDGPFVSWKVNPCAVANVARTDYAHWPKDASPRARPIESLLRADIGSQRVARQDPPAGGDAGSVEASSPTGFDGPAGGGGTHQPPPPPSPQQWLKPLTWVQLRCRRRGAVHFTPSGRCRIRRSGTIPTLSGAARLDMTNVNRPATVRRAGSRLDSASPRRTLPDRGVDNSVARPLGESLENPRMVGTKDRSGEDRQVEDAVAGEGAHVASGTTMSV